LAWFLNNYVCDQCDGDWTDEWSCCCDDQCPHCGARDMSPVESDDLTIIVRDQGADFIVLWSPETAEHNPDYCEVGRFPTRALAYEFIIANERLSVLT